MVAGGHDAQGPTTRIVLSRGKVTIGATIVGGGLLAALCCQPGVPPVPPPPPTATVPAPVPEPPPGAAGAPAEPPEPPAPPLSTCEAVKASERAAERTDRRDTGRVVGGQTSEPGQFPASVSLQWGNSNHYCGGTVAFRDDLVVTAAHCKPRLTDTVVVGRHDLRTSQGRALRIREVLTHARYNQSPHDYDYALIQLAEPSGVAPLPLMISGDQRPATVTVVGWGRVSEGGPLAPQQQFAELPFLSNAYCATRFGAFTPRMACAGFLGGAVSGCQGDSGGGYLYLADGQWVLAGIVSFGVGCARPNEPDFMAFVPPVVGWFYGCAAELQ